MHFNLNLIDEIKFFNHMTALFKDETIHYELIF